MYDFIRPTEGSNTLKMTLQRKCSGFTTYLPISVQILFQEVCLSYIIQKKISCILR